MNNKYNLKELKIVQQPSLPLHSLFWEINVFNRTKKKLKSSFYQSNDMSLMANYKPINNIYCFSQFIQQNE